MGLAILATMAFHKNDAGERIGNYGWIIGGLVVGTIAGWISAKKVKMTAMPQMVSLFNGMGGACAALISISEYDHLMQRSGTATVGVLLRSEEHTSELQSLMRISYAVFCLKKKKKKANKRH